MYSVQLSPEKASIYDGEHWWVYDHSKHASLHPQTPTPTPTSLSQEAENLVV